MAWCGQEVPCFTKDPETGYNAKCKCKEEVKSLSSSKEESEEDWWDW
jgi:hypothetical protein